MVLCLDRVAIQQQEADSGPSLLDDVLDDAWAPERLEEYRARIYGRIVGLVGDLECAADLTQEVYFKALRALPTTERRAETPSAWLYRIATNIAYDELRRRQLVRWTSMEALVEQDAHWNLIDPDDSDEWCERAEVRRRVRQTLQEIKPKYRQALLLYHQQGQTTQEVASTLGIPMGGIKMHMWRAANAFKETYTTLLEQDGEEQWDKEKTR